MVVVDMKMIMDRMKRSRKKFGKISGEKMNDVLASGFAYVGVCRWVGFVYVGLYYESCNVITG
jgi:hypothetical protein